MAEKSNKWATGLQLIPHRCTCLPKDLVLYLC